MPEAEWKVNTSWADFLFLHLIGVQIPKIYLIVKKLQICWTHHRSGLRTEHYNNLVPASPGWFWLMFCVNFMFPCQVRPGQAGPADADETCRLYVRQHGWPFPCEMSLNYCNWKTHPNQMFVLKVVSVIASVSPTSCPVVCCHLEVWRSFYVVNFLPKW